MQLNREMRPWALGAALQMIKEMQENKHAKIETTHVQTVTNNKQRIKWLEGWSGLHPGRVGVPLHLKLGESSLRKLLGSLDLLV